MKMLNPSQEPAAPTKAPNQDLKGHRCSLHLQNQDRAKIRIMGVSKTSDYIQIKIKMPNLSPINLWTFQNLNLNFKVFFSDLQIQ